LYIGPVRSHAFISYAHEDADSARVLHREILALGVQPWLDIIDLVPGQDWQLAVTKALHESSHVIVLISRASVGKRGYVQKEVRDALEILATFPPGAIYIVPVRLDESEPAHAALARLHRIDYFVDAEAAIRQLARALKYGKESSYIGKQDADQPRLDVKGAPEERQLMDVLKILRGETRFFWSELRDLPANRDNFMAEMQGRTLYKVKDYLDYLVDRGHLSYRVEQAYNQTTDGSPILNVIVENVTTQLKNLSKIIANPPPQ
jgi:hypothetical protein